MNFTVDLNTLILTGVGGLVTWVLNGVSAIKKDLREINGRLGKVETWQVEHEKIDDERIKLVRTDLNSVWGVITKLQDKR